MFAQTLNRIGFACKPTDVGLPQITSTTIKWLGSQTKEAAVSRLRALMQQNVQTLEKHVRWLGTLPNHLRMYRISSELCTAYTHPDWMWFYFEPETVAWLETNLSRVGELARALDVRLSFHPGQFCVLASDNPEIVERSIMEFEYHVDMIRYMGFGREFQDFKCNVHIGGKQGPSGIKRAVRSLSREARNVLCIENAEFSWGLDASLELVDTCALTLDVHHHWIATGEYLKPTDIRVRKLWESWRGVRPVVHYSQSREDVIGEDWDQDTLVDLQQVLALGYTRARLRAHSEMYWNTAQNSWLATFVPHADVMCEAKQKNLAAHTFANSVLP
jgi:UV DNA damage repair endonuclease